MQRDSSVLTSLAELSRMEHERQERERRREEAERHARAHREMERLRAIEEENERRERAEAVEREERQRLKRAEDERLRAIREATVEAARVEAMARAQRERDNDTRARVLETERATLTFARSRAERRFYVTLGASLFVLLGSAVAYAAAIAPRQARTEDSLRKDVAVLDARLEESQKSARQKDEQLEKLQGKLENAESRANQLEKRVGELEKARPSPNASSSPPNRHGSVRDVVPKSEDNPGFITCPPGTRDPLCLHR